MTARKNYFISRHPVIIMQALERKISVLVTPEVYKRIAALRRGKQTYGDVIEESIKALEEKNNISNLPCIDDVDLDELDKDITEEEFEKNYVSLESSPKRYEKEHM